MQRDDGVLTIVLAGKQCRDAHLLQIRLEGGQLLEDLRNQAPVLFLVGHLNQSLQVVIAGLQIADLLDGVLEALELCRRLGRRFWIVPEIRLLHLSLVFDYAILFASEVKVNPLLPLTAVRGLPGPSWADPVQPLISPTFFL